jgi:hypothetical protein
LPARVALEYWCGPADGFDIQLGERPRGCHAALALDVDGRVRRPSDPSVLRLCTSSRRRGDPGRVRPHDRGGDGFNDQPRTHPDYLVNLLTATGDETVLIEWFKKAGPTPRTGSCEPHWTPLNTAGGVATHLRPATTTEPSPKWPKYAGKGVGDITRSQSAHQVFRRLVSRPI